MFVIVYRWKIKPGKETQFQEAWAERTKEITDTMGGLGSRLHVTEDNCWIAYAQWPSRETWEAASSTPGPDSRARDLMVDATEAVEALYTMDVVSDLLV